MNHITGGGFYENIPRALPAGYAARIDTTSFPTPKIFDWLQQQGNIDTNEMYNILIWVLAIQLSLMKRCITRIEDFSRTRCGSLSDWSYCEK